MITKQRAMKVTFEVPDGLAPVVLEIMESSSLPGWEEGEGLCSPKRIMERLKVTNEQYHQAVQVIEDIKRGLEGRAK